MARRKKHKHFNEVPPFFTTDVAGRCVVYELSTEIVGMTYIECLFKPISIIRYDGNDTLIEKPNGESSIFLELRTGTLLPEIHGDLELCWFENDTTLDDILTMCSL